MLAELHAPLGHVAGHRRDHGIAPRGNPGIAKGGLGLEHGGIVVHLGAVDQGMRRARLAYRLRQRRFGQIHGLACMPHFLWRNGVGGQ